MGAVLADARRCGGATSPDIRALGHVVGRILELELGTRATERELLGSWRASQTCLELGLVIE